MKLLAVVGTNAPFSYNRFLARSIAKRYGDKADIEVKEIDQIKPFSRSEEPDQVTKEWIEDIKNADGVILCTPAVVGTSYGIQGASRAQEEAREILLSPDMSANVLPGNEVLIAGAANSFDKSTGDLINEQAASQLDVMMDNFIKFIEQANK